MIDSVNGKTPVIDPTAYVAPTAVVLGDVTLGAQASIWYGVVLRGDINSIHVGDRTSIQDNSVIHVRFKGQGTWVGSEVVVGHSVVLHSCTIEDRCMIGMGAVVLDGARVGAGALLAAGAVLPPGKEVPPGMLAVGNPAKVLRALTPAEIAGIADNMKRYLEVTRVYQDPSARIPYPEP